MTGYLHTLKNFITCNYSKLIKLRHQIYDNLRGHMRNRVSKHLKITQQAFIRDVTIELDVS